MRKINPFTSKEHEQGFTLIEVLVGMAILSLLGAGVWAGVTSALRVVTRVHDTAIASSRLLQLDDRLRDAASRIRAPWWTSDIDAQESEGTWRVPYLDGAPDKWLVLSFKAGVVSIDDGVSLSVFPGFSSASFSIARDKGGVAYALNLELEGKGIGHIALFDQLGGFPLTEKTTP